MGGERHPDKVYSDFTVAFDRIVNASQIHETNARPRSTGTFTRVYKSQEPSEPVDDNASIVNVSTTQEKRQGQIIWIGKWPFRNYDDYILVIF